MPSDSEPGIVEHEPGDLTCIVDGGLRLSALQSRLAPHRQRFSLDPPGDPTLAECLLDDLSGPLRHRFGTMRDLVIGVSVVLPDGARAHSGGKVVKNVAGYDLGEALLRLGRPARHGRAARAAAAPPAGRVGDDSHRRRTGSASCTGRSLVPSAVDIVGESMYVLFEGAPRSRRRTGGCPRRRGTSEPWAELRALQAALPGRRRWDGGPAPLVRPGPRVAYTEAAEPPVWSPLAERVLEALCSPS